MLFSKSSSKYSKIITFKSVEGAKESVDKLYSEYRNAKTKSKKTCDECNKTFRDSYDLKRHLKSKKHSG